MERFQAHGASPSTPSPLDAAVEALYAGRLAEADGILRAALAETPDRPELLRVLGAVLVEMGRYGEAVTTYRRVTALAPETFAAHLALAELLRSMDRVDEAEECYCRALALAPDPATELKRATLMPPVPKSVEDIAIRRKRLEDTIDRLLETDFTVDDPRQLVGRTTFHLSYHGLDNRSLQEKMARLYLKACPNLNWTAPRCLEDRESPPIIRVGFISRYFSNHTITKLFRGLMVHLPRERFHVTAFHLGPEDGGTDLVKGSCDTYVHLSGSLETMRETIAEAHLDVLHYTDIGMDKTTYFLAFARLAPVQCASWGHPETTGIPNMDYFISSDPLDRDDGQELYSETLVRPKGTGLYYTRPRIKDILTSRAALGLKDAWTLYVCPQSLFKFHPDFDTVVAEILKRDTKGRFVIIKAPGTIGPLLRRMEARHAEMMDRVIVLPRLDARAFFGLMAMADALLDPLRFGGGNTTFEAAAMGAPVVTLPSRFLRERISLACLRKMGIEDTVAKDEEDYVKIALRLANDKAWHKEISDAIKANAHKLFEDGEEVTQYAAFLTRAVTKIS